MKRWLLPGAFFRISHLCSGLKARLAVAFVGRWPIVAAIHQRVSVLSATAYAAATVEISGHTRRIGNRAGGTRLFLCGILFPLMLRLTCLACTSIGLVCFEIPPDEI